MNPLRRVVAQTVRSQSTAKSLVWCPTSSFAHQYCTKVERSAWKAVTAKSLVWCPTSSFTHQYCTKVEWSAWKAVDWPRPSEIPFQAKVANSVNLIGYVDAPIQFETSPDGKDWAGTVIIQKAYTVPLWIPILFEGDLAHVALSHLKKDDHIHIAGQLTADPPAVDGIEGQANVQVMVHSLNFIEPSSQMGKSLTARKQEVVAIDHSVSKKKDTNAALRAWHDLLDNPEQWQDCRSDKLKGLVKPKYPDFRRKDGALALWLNQAPNWALSKLGVMSEVQTYKSTNVKQSQGAKTAKSNNEKQYKGDEFWSDLLKNPNKWWDNRSDKRSEKYPDFKHKETGKALWLTDAPAWVKSELPPVKSKQKAASGKRDTLLS